MLGCVRRKIGKCREDGKTELAGIGELCEESIIIHQLRPKPGQRLYRWSLG